jgi:hypothetical protein
MIRLLLRGFAAVIAVRVKLRGSQSWLRPSFKRLPRNPEIRHTPKEIAWAVAAASRYVPKATCLVQALAAESLLAQAGYPSRLHIGVAPGKPPDGRGLDAHAWLECGGQALVGGANAGRYRPLFTRDGPVE